MSTNNTKTVTLRLNSEYERILREQASKNHVSLNTLANQIVGDWSDYNRFLDKYSTITMPKESFVSILNDIDENKIIKIAQNMSQQWANFMFFKWSIKNGDNFVNFLNTFFERFGYGNCIVSRQDHIQTLNINHDLGYNGTIFLKNFVLALSKIIQIPSVEISQNGNTMKIILNQNDNHYKMNQILKTCSTSKEKIHSKHYIVTYATQKELSELCFQFIKQGQENNFLNVLFLSKKQELSLRTLLKQNKISLKFFLKDSVIFIHEDIIQSNGNNSFFESILEMMNSISSIVTHNKKIGINFFGTFASHLYENGKEDLCLKLEKNWDILIKYYSIPINLVCPYQKSEKQKAFDDLQGFHPDGIKKQLVSLTV